eukprot:2582041-Pleurochrysis_carterae.AAC.1
MCARVRLARGCARARARMRVRTRAHVRAPERVLAPASTCARIPFENFVQTCKTCSRARTSVTGARLREAQSAGTCDDGKKY